MFASDDGPEGSIQGAVYGTSWHGIFESDDFRSAFLGAVAERSGFDWRPRRWSFAEAREDQARRLGLLIAEHADTEGLVGLIETGVARELPLVAPAGVP